MKKGILYLFLLILAGCNSPFYFSDDRFITKFEEADGKESASFEESLSYYKKLSSRYGTIALKTITDGDKDVNLVIYNSEGTFNINSMNKDKLVVMITNSVYKEQSEGVDATMLLMRNLAQEQIKVPKNVVVVSVAGFEGVELDSLRTGKSNFMHLSEKYYNIDRDFIKLDSDYALALENVFHKVRADVVIDTRSLERINDRETIFYKGAIAEKQQKLSSYIDNILMSKFGDSLKVKAKPIEGDSIQMSEQLLLPFPKSVYSENNISTGVGYFSLWQAVSLKIATQLGKEYKVRVEDMYNALKVLVSVLNSDAKIIKEFADMQRKEVMNSKEYHLNYGEDSKEMKEVVIEDFVKDTIKGDTIERINVKKRKFYFPMKYVAKDKVRVPKGYIIPSSFKDVVKKMQASKVEFKSFEKDSLVDVTCYKIDSFETYVMPVEGHYKHYDVKTSVESGKLQVRKGDMWIPTDQAGKAYIIEVLEPSGRESFFNWNFFDIAISDNKRNIYPVYRIE